MSDDEIWQKQYEMMLTFWAEEGTRFWHRFEVFLAVNSGLLGAFPIILSLVPDDIIKFSTLTNVGILSISVIGIVVSVTWFFLTMSGKGIQDHWKEKIEEFETYHIDKIGITIDFDRKRKWWEFKTADLAKPIPLAFIFAWIITLWIGIGVF